MRFVLGLLVIAASCKSLETAAPAPSVSSAPGVSAPAVASSNPAPTASLMSGNSAGRTFYTFDKDTAGSPPTGFVSAKTGGGRDGKWTVRAEPDAPSAANVLAQTDADATDSRFPILFADQPVLSDVFASVRCKPVSGKVEQACGLVVRFYDANNYYVVRADALQGNVRLYVVKDGKRQQIATWSGKVPLGEWHRLLMSVHGNHFAVKWNEAKVIDQTDATFSAAGKVGVWTMADSISYFDDLVVGPLVNL